MIIAKTMKQSTNARPDKKLENSTKATAAKIAKYSK
jgi:hypothetical protein